MKYARLKSLTAAVGMTLIAGAGAAAAQNCRPGTTPWIEDGKPTGLCLGPQGNIISGMSAPVPSIPVPTPNPAPAPAQTQQIPPAFRPAPNRQDEYVPGIENLPGVTPKPVIPWGYQPGRPDNGWTPGPGYAPTPWVR